MIKNGNNHNQDFNKRRRYDTPRSSLSLQKSAELKKKQLSFFIMSIAGNPVLILVEHLFNEELGDII